MSALNQMFAGNSVASNSFVSGINNVGYGTILAANKNRHGWYIQNLGVTPILVNFGPTTPTTGQFNLLLQGGSVQYDGNGASWSDQFGIYRGPVSITGLNNITPVYIAWDL